MAINQLRSKRKISSGRYKNISKKLKSKGSLPTHTKLEETRVQRVRVRGGHEKRRLLSSNIVHLYDPKTKKTRVSEIITVASNEANRNFVRRNIITKGTILETKDEKAKVTSRPGQEGSLQAVLL